MKLTINWGEIKTTAAGKRIFEGAFIGEDGKEFNASIWELDRDNKQFPGFSDLRPGATFEGNPWTSPTTGKTSIYPPKPVSEAFKGQKGGNSANITKAQTVKREDIKVAQERKNTVIQLSGAMRDAVLIVTTFYRGVEMEDSDIQDKIKKWRAWFLENHGDETDTKAPF